MSDLGEGTARVTALRAGVATVEAKAGGVVATFAVRALPDFGGRWTLQIRYISCNVPPRWGAGFCGNTSATSTANLDLTRTNRDGVAGALQYTSVNGNLWTGTLSGVVATDGTLSLTGRLSSPRSNGVLFTSDVLEWSTVLSSTFGMTGRYTEVLTWVGERDQGFISLEVIRATRN